MPEPGAHAVISVLSRAEPTLRLFGDLFCWCMRIGPMLGVVYPQLVHLYEHDIAAVRAHSPGAMGRPEPPTVQTFVS